MVYIGDNVIGDRIYDSIHQTMFLIIKENLSGSRELRKKESM